MDPKPNEIHTILKNGEKVKVNDHVYCSPNWSIRDGTPYSIARIMEFLPPEIPKNNALSLKAKGKSKETYTRVRLAWYYRPSDVSDRAVADSRLLLAAIYSEICDISQLRSKCYVIHKDKLANLAEWKKKPDHFYFHRLFDPYIKREFEVLLSTEIRNLPQNIREVLVSRYEYIVAEKEVVPDLTDQLRLCETCGNWCAHLDAVQCARCKGHFHMSCVSPPLLAKPARGYGWTCAPCSRRHEDQVDNGGASLLAGPQAHNRENTPRTGNGVSVGGISTGRTGRGRGRPRKERPGTSSTNNEEELQVKHYKLWPFRYFGLYTVAEDTLDPDDLIFPRAATRVGPKYQANVPPGPGDPPATAVSSTSMTPTTSTGSLAHAPVPPDIEERGGDATVDLLANVNEDTPEQETTMNALLDRLCRGNHKQQRHSVDWLTEFFRRACAMRSIGKLDMMNMNYVTRLEKWKKHETKYTDRAWMAEEAAAFEEGIRKYGAELRQVQDIVGTRSMPEVVRYYGHWKNGRLREENARLREPGAYNKTVVSKSGAETPAARSQASSDDEESSLVDVPATTSQAYSRSTTYCAACRTRDSKVWWKAPKGLASNILCDACGINWRKYADLNARPNTREESALNSAAANVTPASVIVVPKPKAPEKREGTPLTAPAAKKAKYTEDFASTKYRCSACYHAAYYPRACKCKVCGVEFHTGACGAVLESPNNPKDWICDLCQNEKTPEHSLYTDCVLCPRITKEEKVSNKNPYFPANDSYLRAIKPTEGQAWAHTLCAVWIPELQFADTTTLKPVEGISTLPVNRWKAKCSLCKKDGGAVTRCVSCPKEYHVSCAWKIGHKFGFDVAPVKSSRRDITNTVTFKGSSGLMSPIIICKDHYSGWRRQIYGICDLNEAGETAVQVYCRTYKQAPIAQSHSLLRKARRLDQLLDGIIGDSHSTYLSEQTPVADPKCCECHTEYSPFFHPSPDNPDALMCHRCFSRAEGGPLYAQPVKIM